MRSALCPCISRPGAPPSHGRRARREHDATVGRLTVLARVPRGSRQLVVRRFGKAGSDSSFHFIENTLIWTTSKRSELSARRDSMLNRAVRGGSMMAV